MPRQNLIFILSTLAAAIILGFCSHSTSAPPQADAVPEALPSNGLVATPADPAADTTPLQPPPEQKY